MDAALASIVESLRSEHSELSAQLEQTSLFDDPKTAAIVSRRHNHLSTILATYTELEKVSQQIAENLELIQSNDELAEMASLEMEVLKERQLTLSVTLEDLLLPSDPNDERDAILEIRSGAGGDEAELFVAELFRMYTRYAEMRGWRVEIANLTQSEIGGYKEVIAEISGENIYRQLQFESGVHRVQRVPATEKQGRIHTSTVTVAILAVAEEADVHINEADVSIDVYRSGGAGGQHVNTTDSAVRLTHKTTGIVVTCQDERSQHKNKAKAFAILRSRLFEIEQERIRNERSEARLGQIGTGDRSEKIRTYNFPQDRCTDHRINESWSNLPRILDGECGEIFETLQSRHRAELRAQVART